MIMNTKIFSFNGLGKTFAIGAVAILITGMFASVAFATVIDFYVTSPNGGEAWGGIQNITWVCTDDTNSPDCSDSTIVNILYSPDGGSTWENAIDSVTGVAYVGGSLFADAGTFSWNTNTHTESSNGLIKVVMDTAPFNDTSDASFTVDNTPPVINTITTDDSDGNGFIDSITLTFTEANNMDATRNSTSGFTVAGHTLGATGVWSGQSFTFTIIETGDQTDATPDVAYTSPVTETDRLQDEAGNDLVDFAATTPTDGAKPVMMSAVTGDLDSNGQIDVVNVTFSEDLNGTTVNSSGSDFAFDLGYTAASASESSPGVVTIILNESGTPDTGVTPLLGITGTETIEDLLGNALGNGDLGSTITPADGAAPVAMSSEYFTWPTAPSNVDRFRIYFSEDISATPFGDFANIADDVTVTANGLIGFANPTAIGDYNNGTDNVYFSITGGGTGNLTGANGGTEPTWAFAYDGTNTLQDVAGNHWTAIALGAETMVDKARPVVIDDLALDINGDGDIETLELQFSEFIEDADFLPNAILDWSLSSDNFTSNDVFNTFNSNTLTLGGGVNVNDDDFVRLTLIPSDVSGTGVVEYKYTNSGDDITDSDTNVLKNISAISAADGAAPQIIELIYQDDNNDGMIDQATFNFSEVVDYMSVLRGNDGVFTNVGDFTGMVFGPGSSDSITTNTNTSTVVFTTPATVKDTRDDSGTLAFSTQTAFKLIDATGNTNSTLGAQSQATITDGAAPVILTGTGSSLTTGDGVGNTYNMTLIYTEDVSSYPSSVTPSDYVVKVAPNSSQIAVSSVSFPSGNPEQIELTLDPLDPNQTTAPLDVTYAFGIVKDWVNNQAQSLTNQNITDKANPILIGFVANPNPAGIGNNLSFTLTFSEPMNTGIALTGTIFDVVSSGLPGPYTTTVDTYSGNTWTGNYTNNPIVVGIPESGTHLFGSPVAGGVDPAGNGMAVLGTLDLTFVIDSVYPETTGLEVFPSAFSLGMPVLITATVNDDLEVNGAELFVEIGGTPVSFGTMTESQSSNGGKTKTYEKTILLGSGFGFVAGETYNVYVVGSDVVNIEPLDKNGDGTNDIMTETITISGDTTAPVLTLDGENTTVNVDADTYAISGNIAPGDFTVVKVFRMVGVSPSGTNDVEIGLGAFGPTEGHWEATVTLPQDQTTKYYAEAFDISFNSVQSGILTIVEASTADITSPTGLTISTTNATVNSDYYTISGSITADSDNVTVEVMDGTTVMGTVVVPAGNTLWSVVVSLTQGVATTFTARATDESGNSSTGGSVIITEDPTAGADLTAPVGTVTTADATVNADSYVISGTLVADTDAVTITVNDGSADVASTIVTAGGTAWSVTVTLPQDVATTFAITATDASNNTATIIDSPVTITEDSSLGVDSTPPAGTVTTLPTTVNMDFYSIEGTLTADSDNVSITINNGSSDVGTAIVTAGGTSWSATVPLPQGVATTFTANATDASANTDTLGSVTITEDSTGSVNLTGLSVSSVADVTASLDWSTDATADNGDYRIGTSPYTGSWTSLTIVGVSGSQALSGLTPNTTYYYQVRFEKNGQTIYSVPLSFVTSNANTGVLVSIQAIKSYATADDTYANGWKWQFNVTLNDLTETDLAMKFNQWVSGTNVLDTANNMRYSVDNATWTTIIANGTYPATDIDVSAIDNSASTGGRQVTVYVEMKVPTGTAGGSYSTSYGVRAQ